MGISTSTLASLLIAGTAIGGSTLAVMANTAPSEINSPSITQTTTTDPSAKLPGETLAPVDPSATPMPTPTLPVMPPPTFNGDDEDDEEEDEGYEDEGDYEEDEEDDEEEYEEGEDD